MTIRWDYDKVRWDVILEGAVIGYIYSDEGRLHAYVALRSDNEANAPIGNVSSMREGIEHIYFAASRLSEEQRMDLPS